ncbi:MAG: DUF924 domain-containing protein [Alphaproteobacteria bacterium]|nr:DUF924 domain-containing protein [Alphaproteobacteria bacterium]
MAEWNELIDFWFSDHARERWFAVDADFDAELGRRFGARCEEAMQGACDHWQKAPEGALALVLALDQLPRNLFRGTARAYAADAAARRVARLALQRGDDRGMDDERRVFFYLPFEHSEDLLDQELCVRLMRQLGERPENLRYAERHLEIIARFGRFPHRNKALGRATTALEEAFLREPMSSF